MKNDVGVQFERSLQCGCEQRVVNNQKCACLVRNLGSESNVGEFQCRIRGCFNEDKASLL
jgi:hypothetical protein